MVNTPAKGDETEVPDEIIYSKNRSGIAWMMRARVVSFTLVSILFITKQATDPLKFIQL